MNRTLCQKQPNSILWFRKSLQYCVYFSNIQWLRTTGLMNATTFNQKFNKNATVEIVKSGKLGPGPAYIKDAIYVLYDYDPKPRLQLRYSYEKDQICQIPVLVTEHDIGLNYWYVGLVSRYINEIFDPTILFPIYNTLTRHIAFGNTSKTYTVQTIIYIHGTKTLHKPLKLLYNYNSTLFNASIPRSKFWPQKIHGPMIDNFYQHEAVHPPYLPSRCDLP